MKPTRGELLDVIYRFYPRGLHNYSRIHVPPGEPFYDDTEEHLRLVEAATRLLTRARMRSSRRIDAPRPRAQEVAAGCEKILDSNSARAIASLPSTMDQGGTLHGRNDP